MPYYTGDAYGFRGDYYRGDYYRGDPGLFSFIGKALGGVAKLGTNVVRAGLGLQAPVKIPTFQPPFQPGFGVQTPTTRIGIFGGGGQPGMPAVPFAPMQIGMACGRGQRQNRSTYVTRGGGTSRWPMQLLVHQKGTECVKVRRMNVGNARALRRSIRRVAGFAKIVKRARRAISRAASAVGVRRGGGKAKRAAPAVKIVRAA